MQQPSLPLSVRPRFDSGIDLLPSDHIRLGAQLLRVLTVMSDGQWRTVPQLQADIQRVYGVKDPEPSLSAQLRNLRKPSGGSHVVERRRMTTYFEFRVLLARSGEA